MTKALPFLAFACCITIFSCKPKEPVFVGGKGGTGVLLVTPQHHGRNIDSLTVYIKYNSLDASDTYDDSAKCVDLGAQPVATFSNLKRGDYYLYGYGYDTFIHQ